MSQSTTIDQIIEVPVEKIRVSPFQPRRVFADQQIDELASSIEEVGIIQPPVARYLPEEDVYELISGERRMRAAQKAGMRFIPIILRENDTQHSAEAALVENIQRVDLNPIEVAEALRALSQKFGLNQDELAHRVGKKRSTVANYLRLLSLPEEIQESLGRGEITTGHAKAILSLETKKEQLKLHKEILKKGLTVRQTERTSSKSSKKEGGTSSSRKAQNDIHLTEIEKKIEETLGTKVSIQGSAAKGKVVIDYYSLADLEKILQAIGTPQEATTLTEV